MADRQTIQQYLLNVEWLRPAGSGSNNIKQIPATSFSAKHGTQNAACSEGGECVGWIKHDDWIRYDGFNFGNRTDRVEIRAASISGGGSIELRMDSPAGKLLGSCLIPNTGGWQSWTTFNTKIKPVSGVHKLCLLFHFKHHCFDKRFKPGLLIIV